MFFGKLGAKTHELCFVLFILYFSLILHKSIPQSFALHNYDVLSLIRYCNTGLYLKVFFKGLTVYLTQFFLSRGGFNLVNWLQCNQVYFILFPSRNIFLL